MSDALSTPAAANRDLSTWLLKVAWFSILLGFVMQVLTAIAVKLCDVDPVLRDFIRDLAQKVTWSTFVCAGLAIGNAASRANPGWVGFVGLLAAPIALVVARAVQKGTATAISATPPEAGGTFVFSVVLAIKALEYGGLGAVLAWFARRGEFALRPYLMTGLAFGLVFGGLVLAVLYFASDPRPPQPKIASQAVNEVLFPLGCALVLCASNRIGLRARG